MLPVAPRIFRRPGSSSFLARDAPVTRAIQYCPRHYEHVYRPFAASSWERLLMGPYSVDSDSIVLPVTTNVNLVGRGKASEIMARPQSGRSRQDGLWSSVTAADEPCAALSTPPTWLPPPLFVSYHTCVLYFCTYRLSMMMNLTFSPPPFPTLSHSISPSKSTMISRNLPSLYARLVPGFAAVTLTSPSLISTKCVSQSQPHLTLFSPQ